jgi:hypothetical protein
MSLPSRFRARVALAVLTSLCVTSVAFARIVKNTIDPVGLVTERGAHVVLTGPVECTEGERLHTRVTVSQRSTGAVAEGRALDTCIGGVLQEWTVHASVQGAKRFEPGPAIAVALAHTTDRGKANDAHQWLVPVTLVEE